MNNNEVQRIRNYVKKYFRYNYMTIYNKFSKKDMEELVDKITANITSKYTAMEIRSGKVDIIISKSIEACAKRCKAKFYEKYIGLKNHIYDYLRINNLCLCHDKTVELIADRMVDKIRYNHTKLMFEQYDSEIDKYYDVVYDNLYKQMHSYICKYISKQMDQLYNINEEALADNIINELMANSRYSASDLLLGRCNDLIMSHVEKHINTIEGSRPASVEHICKYVVNNIEDVTVDEQLVRDAMRIDILLTDRGLSSEDIVSGNYDDEICKVYLGILMRRNSVVNEDTATLVKRFIKTSKVPRYIAGLLIAATLSTGVGVLISNGIDSQERASAETEIAKIDDFEYSDIYTIHNDDFAPTVDNVLKFYSDFKDYNDNDYNYLGFYRAYSYIKEDRLTIMDQMLDSVKRKAASNDEYSEFYSSIEHCSSYLEFIYDRLDDMGFEEIRLERYQDALSDYVLASYSADEEETAMDVLEEKGKKETIETIEEVVRKYQELSDERILELGKELKQESKGRKH